MARSKHGRERRRGATRSAAPRAAAHSHRTERRADRKAERKTERKAERRASRRAANRSNHRSSSRPERHIVADVEPLDVDGVRTVAIGSVAWIVAFVAMLPFIGTLRDHDRLSWLWICIAGFGLGLIGVEYCRRRRNNLAEESTARRSENSRFGAAG